MDFSRIEQTLDIATLQGKCVTVVGVGGAAGLCKNLVRCGVGGLRLVDKDTVGAENICRQDFLIDSIGQPKVEALRKELLRINPDVFVETFPLDFCSLTDTQIDMEFGDSDAFTFATDSFPAQARGNEVALRLGTPAVWIGLYRGGCAGEIVFWHPGIAACYRCLCAARYELHDREERNDPRSDGATILDVQLLDSIAGMIVLGLLTRGAKNRTGRLIEQLGDRNFLQVKIDPEWNWNGRDVIRENLAIPEETPAYISFCTIARSDPTHGEPPCPDCMRFRRRTAANSP